MIFQALRAECKIEFRINYNRKKVRKMNHTHKKSDSAIHIDILLIPQYTQETLAAATLDFIHGILAQPGGREALDKKIVELGLR